MTGLKGCRRDLKGCKKGKLDYKKEK
jgi:hypothetical protein